MEIDVLLQLKWKVIFKLILDYKSILNKGWNKCYEYQNTVKQGTTHMDKFLCNF